MIRPAFWINFWRVRSATCDYPPYDPPHKGKDQNLSDLVVQDNFDYFMKVRHERLTYFQNWLARNFDVNSTLDGNGVLALEMWLKHFGGGLILDNINKELVYDTYMPIWVGKYRGYNVIVDIAIFLGEYLLTKRPRLHWAIYRERKTDRGEIIARNLNRPVLIGFPKPLFQEWQDDLFLKAYGSCARCRRRAKVFELHYEYYLEELTYQIKQDLHIAGLPDGEYEYVFGDFRNEPL
jgi:hypothetical protein